MSTITTYSGVDFTPLDPQADQVRLEDIAQSLSLLCRGNGHVRHFFSVAQHSVNAAREAEARGHSRRVQLACLMHDASEAYLSDIPRPVKAELHDYLVIEERLQDFLYELFCGSPLTDDEIAQLTSIDDDMLAAEFPVLMGKDTMGREPNLSATPDLSLRDFDEVKQEFLTLATALI